MLKTLNTLDPNNPAPQVVETRVGGSSSGWTVYGVYQLDPAGVAGNYSTITTGRRDDGKVVAFGRLGTERLPAELEGLRGEERYTKVRAWQREMYQRAYDLIAAEVAIPTDARLDMGEIHTFGEDA